jgi:hypothetical protein
MAHDAVATMDPILSAREIIAPLRIPRYWLKAKATQVAEYAGLHKLMADDLGGQGVIQRLDPI